MPKNDPIWPEIGIFVHFGPGLASSFGGLVGGFGARAVSRNTPIYFISFIFDTLILSNLDSCQAEEEDLYASVRVRRKDYEDVEDRQVLLVNNVNS